MNTFRTWQTGLACAAMVAALAASQVAFAIEEPATPAPTPDPRTASGPLVPADVNGAAWPADAAKPPAPAAIVRAQVLLDRAQFSPGEIDGKLGSSMKRAVTGFQASRQLQPSGELDAPTWQALTSDNAPALVDYTLTEEDVRGPFREVPSDMMAKAEMKELSFSSAAEALGEKYHSNPQLLQELNPGRALDRAGEKLLVPNVATNPLPKASKIVVDDSDSVLMVVDESGRTVAQFPATMGSKRDPLPVGQWKVTKVEPNPHFKYQPDLFWDAPKKHSEAMIPPGPNSPVGVVWIDLSKEHYGIHGTPEPSKIGKTESHGCIRLTNWSATAVANAVEPGTEVVLQK